MDEGAWWAAVYGVAQSQTRLKRLSSSSKKQGKGTTTRQAPDNNLVLSLSEYGRG